MNWFKNLRTVVKLVLAFCLMCGFMAVVGYQGISAVSTLNSMIGTMYEKQLLGLAEIKEANLYRVMIGRELRAAMLSSDKAQREKLSQQVDQYFKLMYENLDKAAKTLVTSEGKAKAAKIRELLPQYETIVKEVARLAVAGNDKEALDTLAKAAGIVGQAEREFTDLSATKEQVGKQTFEESSAMFSRLRATLITVLVVGVLFSLGIGYFIAQLIARPLLAAVEALQKVAEGDLTATLEVDTKDEIGQMAAALNSATGGMREALTEVKQSAESMASASQELASSSEELASGAQEQASSLEETTSTLEEITSTVKQNADNAKQANQVAAGSRDTAEKGGQVVSEAVAAMGQINESSKSIAEIITAIDEIAFQTNLLALNAAVEAARAGEQGRGFAVVATEVRNLAQRSATSAKEIKRLIQDSVRKVENGSTLVNKSGETLHEIVASVKRVTDIVSEIAAASREQSSGIEQVNKAMIQMDQVTQANSSQTEELSSTAQSLSAHAVQLQSLVERFRLDSGPGQRSQSAAPSKPAAAAPPAARAVKMRTRPAATHSDTPTVAVSKVKPNGHDTSADAFANF
jgi:methyl-accepting chemotaxis protein